MPSGYLVTLGDSTLDTGDVISGGYTAFTTDTVIGSGDWTWSGTVGGFPYTDEVEPGTYYLATDGNVYFTPDLGPVDTLTSATATNPPAYTDLDGAIDGTAGADLIDSGYSDAEGDQVDNGLGGGAGNDDTIEAGAGNDTIDAGSGADSIYGGAGADSIEGGSGADLIYGDTDAAQDLTPTPTTITDTNVADTGSGYTVTATPIGGSPSAANIATWSGGFGVAGAISDSDSAVTEQIGYDLATGQSEALIVDLDSAVDELSFSYDHLYTDTFGEEGHWAVYDGGVLVAEGDFTEDTIGSGSGTVTINGVGNFDQLVLTANIQTDLTDGSDYMVSDISFTLPVVEADPYDDSISGGAGDDTIFGEGGDDTLLGGDDNDSIDGGEGADSLEGGSGDDTLIGGAGADTLVGGTGSDSITGGSGDDSIKLSEGDTATGGDDRDTFTLIDRGETGSASITIDGNEGGDDWDTLDLNGVADRSTLSFTDSGDGTLSGTVSLLDGSLVTFSNIEQIICFVSGTRITTCAGAVPVEELQIGDMVLTRDNGYQPVRWIGKTTVPALGDFAPIRISAGTLGCSRDLFVSPQHRLLIRGTAARMLYGSDEVLTAAKHLLNDHSICRQPGGAVTYVHLLLDQHEVIFAENCPTESFFPGDQALEALCPSALHSLFDCLPDLRSNPGSYGPTARPCLTRGETRALI